MLKFFKIILWATIVMSVVACASILSVTSSAIHEIELLLASTQALLATGFLAIIAAMEIKR
jgi:heme/copper-type cytochrome/quinol oxidase subunit 3